MGWMERKAGGNLSYISYTVQYDGDLPGLYPSVTEGSPNKAGIFMLEY